ncbi:uncharacterized protein K489DRAFT_376510 [Dissoconium aciculare CBS 342.82]|uniref:Uncharacterized protein n=1 Tax=Dissoconium aciculare CBS 342.82 TaxID=1314786 RepID=A0A6J3MER4_9PEZI|nr:uncharacterized protein K489DRAFT_376510 [Dissoconium aciculare CBS 342.82]KAF1826109.1 hypothetical protein K489DRAFT_376510 [Dissoconium aciculare CBS 342.82]
MMVCPFLFLLANLTPNHELLRTWRENLMMHAQRIRTLMGRTCLDSARNHYWADDHISPHACTPGLSHLDMPKKGTQQQIHS